MTESRRAEGALERAVRREDWERVALLLLAGVTEAMRTLPRGAIDDVLALLDVEDATGGERGTEEGR